MEGICSLLALTAGRAGRQDDEFTEYMLSDVNAGERQEEPLDHLVIEPSLFLKEWKVAGVLEPDKVFFRSAEFLLLMFWPRTSIH